MFTALSERLTAALKRLTGRGVLSEQDVTETLREIRRHLLEADVSFEVTEGFVERVRERAIGAIAMKTVSPGQQVVKLVHDEIARMLGATDEDLARTVGAQRGAPLQFASVGPTVILLVGLQGSGKTTTAAKLARRLKLEQKAPGLVAADLSRPAAREGRGGALDSRRDRCADQIHRPRRTCRGAACCAPTRTLRPGAHGRPHPRSGRRGGVGREGGRHHRCGGRAAAREEGALETGDGPRGLSRRPEADAGDGTAPAGARPVAGRDPAGAQVGQCRRQAPEARRGDRVVDDARRAGRSGGAHRIAPAADREGRGAYGTGSQPAAGAVPADAEAFEKDVGTLWQLAFGCGAWDGRGRATSGSSSRIRALPATGGSW